jgi:hypothetical protein
MDYPVRQFPRTPLAERATRRIPVRESGFPRPQASRRPALEFRAQEPESRIQRPAQVLEPAREPERPATVRPASAFRQRAAGLAQARPGS